MWRGKQTPSCFAILTMQSKGPLYLFSLSSWSLTFSHAAMQENIGVENNDEGATMNDSFSPCKYQMGGLNRDTQRHQGFLLCSPSRTQARPHYHLLVAVASLRAHNRECRVKERERREGIPAAVINGGGRPGKDQEVEEALMLGC